MSLSHPRSRRLARRAIGQDRIALRWSPRSQSCVVLPKSESRLACRLESCARPASCLERSLATRQTLVDKDEVFRDRTLIDMAFDPHQMSMGRYQKDSSRIIQSCIRLAADPVAQGAGRRDIVPKTMQKQWYRGCWKETRSACY